MKLLIDADSALYRAGCANETREYLVTLDGQLLDSFKYKKDADQLAEELGAEVELHKEAGPVGLSLHNLRECVASMFDIEHNSYELYIGGEGNFRNDLYPEYKANRKEDSRPIHLPQMKKHLYGRYNAIAVHGEEADDRVSWRQMQCREEGIDSCIVGIDKDLDNTPGWHYNYVTKKLYEITPEQADLNFARQLLTGDITDNIPGLPDVGKRRAEMLLPEYSPDWKQTVINEYKERGFDEEYLTLMGRLLWMRRKPEEMWSLDV